MQIFINTDNEEGVKEWAILELQGDLESKTEDPLAGKLIGDLHYTKEGTPFLLIGHHLLFGKVEMMEKPFAVLEKIINSNHQTEYIVKALIEKKVSFSDRPLPLVAPTSLPVK